MYIQKIEKYALVEIEVSVAIPVLLLYNFI